MSRAGDDAGEGRACGGAARMIPASDEEERRA
jgi:hypothetical protein